MGSVDVRRDDYEDGVLPLVCVYTGQPAEVLVDHRSQKRAGAWVLLLLLLGPVGLVAILVVDRMMQVQASGCLPASRRALDDRRRAQGRWNAAAVCGLVALAAGVAIVVAGPALGPLGGVLIGAGFVAAVLSFFAPAITGVRGRPDRTGRTVSLHRVAPEFATAYLAQDMQRAAKRRATNRAAIDAR